MHDSREIRNLNRKISDECDQLLKDLELDMKNMNSNHTNNSLVKNLQTVKKCSQEQAGVKQLSKYNKQVFYINKVKMVELNDVQLSNEANSFSPTVNNNEVTSLNHNNNLMGKSNNQEYFDNLIKLIENAAKNLSE